MAVERRYALLGHRHSTSDFSDWGLFGTSGDYWDKLAYIKSDGVMEIGKYIDFHETDADTDDYDFRIQSISNRLYFSGDVQGGRSLWAGSTNALPALGYANESTSLVLGYASDFAYGLLAGVLGSGNAWVQVGRFDGTATAYDLTLQPLGGATYFGSGTNYANFNSTGQLTLRAQGTHITLYDTNATASTDRGFLEVNDSFVSIWGHDASADVWRRPISGDIGTGEIYIGTDAGSRTTYIGNYYATLKLYGANGTTADFITDHASVSYSRMFANGGATLNCYWYSDATDYGFLGSDGGWDLRITRSTNNVYMYAGLGLNASMSIPAGSGYYLDGGIANYIANNGTSSYTSLYIGGSKGGYSGFYAGHSGMAYMWDSSGNGGPYREANATWASYYVVANDCTSFGGSTSSGSYRIYVTGSAYATGTWTASDERKKRDIKTIPYALDRVCAMRGVEYRWREDADVGQDPERYHVGLIAQEVEKVVPEAVTYAADADSYAVDYSGLVGLLIQAVKELKEELNEFKAERSR